MNQTELNWTQNKNASPVLFWWCEPLHGCLQPSILSRIFHQIVVFSGEYEIVAYWAFFCVVALLASSAQPMAIFAFDVVGNTHTEALMSLLSKSLTRATSYLVAVHLYDRCPSSIPTSKISYVTENGYWLWVKDNCIHLCFPRQRRHVLVNNCSETCIRRTLEHSLRVSKHAGFHYFHKKKKQFHNLVWY